MPQEIVPATLKRPVRTETARAKPKGCHAQNQCTIVISFCSYIVGFSEGMGGKEDSDRSAYRKGPSDFEKKAGAGSDFQPEFVSICLIKY